MNDDQVDMTQRESDALAPYASHAGQTRGRRHAEVSAPTRTEFQRDRDRIVHCTAFRRLVYKTQVFLNHEGDLFRTRMTHSLEVAQLGRSVARTLRLNEDLVEAVALAHDLGHTPFGHAGQDALNECMRAFGGFEHNLQSLRVVDWLEERYPAFDGLNLTFETREGILKHCSAANAQALEVAESDGVAARFLRGWQPSLEAQLCNLADEIAYNAHDVDDGVRSGLISFDQVCAVPLVQRFAQEAAQAHADLVRPGNERRWLYETIRRMLSEQVYDVIRSTEARLQMAAPTNAQEARTAGRLVQFSEGMQRESAALKQFLFRNLYRHPTVMETTGHAQQVVRDLFCIYQATPDAMKPAYALKAQQADAPSGAARVVADYVAGMTDRFAVREHERLTGQRWLPGRGLA